MLVLTAKLGESIHLFDQSKGDREIQFKLISIEGNQARVGIEASKEILILRGKLIEQDRKGNR